VTTEIIQVRDVPADDAQTLRARAVSRNMSLSGYLRELIHEDASRPTMGDVLARIATRDPAEVSGAEVRSFIEADRR
jgi:hypothetical protein